MLKGHFDRRPTLPSHITLPPKFSGVQVLPAFSLVCVWHGIHQRRNPLGCLLSSFLFWFPGLPGTSELFSPCIRNRNTPLHYKERTDNFALLWRALMAQAQGK